MTFFKKKGVAWAVLIVCVIAAVFIGAIKAPEEAVSAPMVDAEKYLRYVDDSGNLLSRDTEEKVAKANARWDTHYGVHVAVVTTFGYGDAADYADHAFDDMGLGNSDMILSLTPDGGWHVAYGYEIEDALTDRHSDNIYYAIQDNPDNDEAVDEFLDAVDNFFSDELPHRDLVGAEPEPSSARGGSILLWIVVILVVILIISVITSDLRTRRRYRPVAVGRPGRPYRRPTINDRPTNRRPTGGFGGSRSSGSRSSFRSSGGSRGGFGGSRGGSRGGRGGRR